MGFFDFIFGTTEKKIQNLKQKKKYQEIAQFTQHEDEKIRQLAIKTLEEMVKEKKLKDLEINAIIDFLEPLIGIKEKLKIEAITDPYEARKLAINEYMKKRDFDNAIRALNRAMELKPGDISFKNNLAAAYSMKGDFDSAQQVWEEILQEKSDEPTAIENYATALFVKASEVFRKYDKKVMKTEEVKKVYSEIMDKSEKELYGKEDPNKPKYGRREDPPPKPAEPPSEENVEKQEAADLLLKAIQLKPDYSNALLQLGDYFFEKGNFERAIKNYLECLNSPKIPSGFRNNQEFRGTVFRKIGDAHKRDLNYDQALNYFQMAINSYGLDESQILLIKEEIRTLK